MANPEHLEIVRLGVDHWNRWRKRKPGVNSDLSGADLRKVRLSRADLNAVNLNGANLSGATLSGADLSHAALNDANLTSADLTEAWIGKSIFDNAELTGATLTEARLRGASLVSARFTRANLTGVDLSGADLTGADLSGAKLWRTDFSRATLEAVNLREAVLAYTTFANVDLSSVRGLDAVDHDGRSTIGIDTLYLSKGNIPEVFLRGTGVPETMISYAKSLIVTAIEYYSLFISYSTADQDFAERLHADLQSKGIRCWFAPRDIQGGKKLHEQIDEAIRLHDKLLLILSPKSMESEWVKTEISKARKREARDKARVLFPVRLVPFEVLRDWECFDADTGKDSAREIREYFIPDFSNWKDHDLYRRAFDRLVRDLQPPARVSI